MGHLIPISIEVRHSFSTNPPCKYILMGINECIYSFLAEFIDYLLDLVQVRLIVYARCHLNGFPHHAESHDVEAPLLKLGDFIIREGEFCIKLFLSRDVRRDLVDHVHSVKNH
jgi:hypothetical protein